MNFKIIIKAKVWLILMYYYLRFWLLKVWKTICCVLGAYIYNFPKEL